MLATTSTTSGTSALSLFYDNLSGYSDQFLKFFKITGSVEKKFGESRIQTQDLCV